MSIENQKIVYPDHTKQEFESMKTYLGMARKFISFFVSRYDSKLRDRMLKSEDAISDIATHLMMADWRWNPEYKSKEGKTRSRQSYRTQCALYAIKSYITKMSNKKQMKSLDFVLDEDIEFKELLADEKAISPLEILIKNEDDISCMLQKVDLTNKQRECIKLYYLESKTLQEISDIYGVSKEAIRQNLVKGVDKLRNQLLKT